MTQQVFINFVLDKSGSMASVSWATTEGFNQFLSEQRDQDGDAWMSLTLFDTTFDPRFVAWGLKDLPNLGTPSNPYYASGATALFDAVGITIEGTERWLENNDWFQGKVVCAILTDGEENSSRKYDQSKINDLIKRKQEDGWEFIFLGAGGSAWLEKTFHSVPVDNFHAYDNNAHSTQAVYSTLSGATSSLRASGQSVAKSMAADKNWAQHRTNAPGKKKDDPDDTISILSGGPKS